MASLRRIVLCAGELSGDMHAAHLVAALFRVHPEASIEGMAGEHCARAGMRTRFEYRRYAVMGFTGVVKSLPRFACLERAMKTLIDGADLFVAVDYPGLNLRLCEYARRRGVRVLYYIAPQVWAWGEGRMARIRRAVDRMAVVLPFEEELYRRAGVAVEYVGHPFMVDHELPEPPPPSARDGVALLPGSRVGEVRTILPLLAQAAMQLDRARPGLRFVVGKSPIVPVELYRQLLARWPDRFELHEDAVQVLASARVAMVASGTATLQSALLETPLAVVYRTSALNYLIARRLVRIPHVGLVNVLLGSEVAPEFVQGRATPERIAGAIDGLLDPGSARERTVDRFRELRGLLARGRGCERVAEMAGEIGT